jgi:hypothetical protein
MSSGSEHDEPPAAVSNQNQEEAEGGHAGTGDGEAGARPDEEGKDSHGGESGASSPAGAGDSSPGAASEGSQATGHPENAG